MRSDQNKSNQINPFEQEAFTAGDFVRQAEAAIDDVLARGRVPVVVGGTSMYTQWLVQGRPDAPRSDPKVEAEVHGMLAPFQAQGDWEVRRDETRSTQTQMEPLYDHGS